MNTNEFLKVTVEQVSQVYQGKRDCCRCGCGGNYTATTFHNDPRSEVDNVKVSRLLKRAKKLVSEGADVDEGDTYLDVRTSEHNCLTFYFDEIGPKVVEEEVSVGSLLN